MDYSVDKKDYVILLAKKKIHRHGKETTSMISGDYILVLQLSTDLRDKEECVQ